MDTGVINIDYKVIKNIYSKSRYLTAMVSQTAWKFSGYVKTFTLTPKKILSPLALTMSSAIYSIS
jgi:hypothetical protein